MSGKMAPVVFDALPPGLVSLLDGSDLPGHLGEAMRLATVDEDSWPHAAMLSFGEVLALDSRRLRFCLSPGSASRANAERSGRAVLEVAFEGAIWEIRLAPRRLADLIGTYNAACFGAEVLGVRMHRSPYADVVSGVTYRLHDPEPVLARWKQQIEALRAP